MSAKMAQRIRIALAAVFMLSVQQSWAVATTIWYVNAAATGANTGQSWPNAFTSLQSALAVAQSGQEVWVAAGTYVPSARTISGNPWSATFALPNGVSLYGGFVGGEGNAAQRNPSAHPTILDGCGVYHVVSRTSYGEEAALVGFTIRGGQAIGTLADQRAGGGIYCTNGQLRIADCLITGNAASDCGGGVHLAEPGIRPVFTHCRFASNTAAAGGGMCVAAQTGPELTDCTFEGNTASGSLGGAIYLRASSSSAQTTIVRCVFKGKHRTRFGRSHFQSLHESAGGQGLDVHRQYMPKR